jgi:hypothetical protein
MSSTVSSSSKGISNSCAGHALSVYTPCHSLSLISQPPADFCMQVPGWNVVGAALESPTSFHVWYYSQRSKPTAGSDAAAAPTFKLRKTLPFVCASGTEAQALVQRVRQGASWQGRDKPPRVMAIINPSSGRGK